MISFNQAYKEVFYLLPLLFIHFSFAENSYSPAVEQTYPASVYWGDTHLHTNLSVDAYSLGNRGLGLDEAYRFAKGEIVEANNGMSVKLRRPLDFLVIADHASNMGVMSGLQKGDPDLLSSSLGRQWASQLKEIDAVAEFDIAKSAELSVKFYESAFGTSVDNNRFKHSVWKNNAALADQNNIPGQFTAFIGYEWTASYQLHRVVIFKDSLDKTKNVIPYSQFDSSNPEDLWAYLDTYEQKTGGEVLAIPHNSNLTHGMSFALETSEGKPLSDKYAKTRSRWEPLLEVTQIKGDSETHPLLSPNDEFADYERLTPPYSIKGEDAVVYGSWLKKNEQGNDNSWQRHYEYARSGLKLGLEQQKKLGVNPFKFGMIGSTDSHTSLATADENNFWGKTSLIEPGFSRVTSGWSGKHVTDKDNYWLSTAWRMNAAGYAGVWAEENTRESLFAAMKRKEVYASTGPRMTVRFFGGWDYHLDDAFKPDLARIGYEKGVPMGGDLTNAPADKSPKFLIRAVKDPDGANLDRVQVIKGWHDKQGELHEKIYNVALSDHRKPNWRGKVKPVGNTVDVSDASYTNTIGDPELAVVWQDPDFNKDELAFYYVRVLEIPTPRWTAYDAKYFGLKDIPEEVAMVTQERAYTSPIWYSPNK